MLINPYLPESREILSPIPGTNIIAETLGVVGVMLRVPGDPIRSWTIQGLYAPIPGRMLGGIRAKLIDQKGFISFCNQRDLEVLLDISCPGAYCAWLDAEYVDVDEAAWCGLCVDEDDLLDDLYDKELEARSAYEEGTPLPAGLSFSRRIHAGSLNDYQELLVLKWDMDPDTGMGPDTRFSTVGRRWSSIERTGRAERHRLWLKV